MNICVESNVTAINIGRVGENFTQSVTFDFTSWREEYGPGVVFLLHKRAQDNVAYFIMPVVEGTLATWNIRNSDTQFEGVGECELVYIINNRIAKSKIWRTINERSLDGSGDVPEPWQPWVDEILEDGALIKEFLATLEGGVPGQVWTKTEDGAEWQDSQGGGGATNHNDLDGRSSANAHPMSAISGLETALNAKTSKTYVDDEIADVRGDIPSEATVAGWGFTKNAGTYSKPSSGIPKSDLASAVQTSLGKADSSVQEAPSDGNQYARKNGAWSVVEAGGGGGAYTVVITQSSGMQQTYTADKTYAEIYAAVIAGNVVLAKLQMAIPTKWRYLRCTGRYNRVIGLEEIIPAHLTFAGVEDDGVITECTIYDDESITVESIAYQNTISDLAAIRSGAAAGATAVQPAALNSYQTKITASGILEGDGAGGVTPADVEEGSAVPVVTSISSASTDQQIPTAKATFDAIQQGGGGGVTPALIYDEEFENVTEVADDVPDLAKYNNLLISIGGKKNAAQTSIPDAYMYINGKSFCICYYTTFLQAITGSYEYGSIVQRMTFIGDDYGFLFYSQSNTSEFPIEQRVQGSASGNATEKTTIFEKLGATTEDDGFKIRFSAELAHARVVIFGY